MQRLGITKKSSGLPNTEQMAYIGISLIISSLILLFIFVKKKQDELENIFQEKYSEKNIRWLDKCAFLAAQESKGYSQTQGMGYLILTDESLYFEMQLLSKTLSIPITSITHVGQTLRMGGKSTGKQWLKIEYIDSNGSDDAIALSVKELTACKKEINFAIKNIQNN